MPDPIKGLGHDERIKGRFLNLFKEVSHTPTCTDDSLLCTLAVPYIYLFTHGFDIWRCKVVYYPFVLFCFSAHRLQYGMP